MKVKGRNEYWFSKCIMKKEFRLTRDVEEKVITIYYSSIGDMNGWSPLKWLYDHQYTSS